MIGVTAALMMSVAADACTSGRARPNVLGMESGGYAVTVHNGNWLDADVYVVHDGAKFRIGFVPGSETLTLALPGTLVHDGTVQLRVDPVGSLSTYTTDQFVVNPGQRIELSVNSVLNMSNYAVWNH